MKPGRLDAERMEGMRWLTRWLTLVLVYGIWCLHRRRGADQVFLAVRSGPRTWEVKLDAVHPKITAVWERWR